MVMDDTFIREVDEELAQDNQLALIKKYGSLFGGVIVCLIAIVGARQYFEAREVRVSGENAIAYQRASDLVVSDPEGALTAFEALAKESPYGYKSLAALRAAWLAAEAGDAGKARRLLAEIAGGTAPQRIKDLARVRLGYLSIEQGPDAVRRVLNGLEIQNTPYGVFASEAVGLAAYQAEKFEEAYLLFERITLHPDAQEGMRRRAESLAALSHLGAQGIALEATAPVQAGTGSLLEGEGFSSALQGALDSLARGELDTDLTAEVVPESVERDDKTGVQDQDVHAPDVPESGAPVTPVVEEKAGVNQDDTGELKDE